jgi:hypothetical protein
MMVGGILLIRWLVRRDERMVGDAFKQFDQKFDEAADAKIQEMETQMEQERAEERAFHARAKRYPATVTSAKQVGELNLRPLLALHLAIEAPEGGYEVHIEHAPDVQEAHRYAKGSKIEVDVDPNNQQNVKCVD